MPTLELLALIFLGALAWLWYDSVHVRDIGIRAAKAACAADALQLLDDTVAIASLSLARDDDGRLRLRRAYGFDYSDTGNNRRRGSLVMLGDEVLVVNTGLRLVAVSPTLH
ncbi:MAG: DUF3301 domain-containing protein [Rhodocyclales bacterium]|nr:DUF3301 domain-containing protein [Rhodocyclales bacterium]